MRVHVFIATTAGPVRVQSIVPLPQQEPPLASHVDVGGTGAARFNTGYREFVNLVVGRCFRAAPFLASIERDIQQGESWRLALLLAHAVEAGDGLTLAGEAVREGDWVVLATGEVTHQLEIVRVERVAEKFESTRTHLDSWLDAGGRVIAVVPEANDADVPSEFRTYCRNTNCLSLIAAADVDAMLSRLEVFDRLMKAERGAERETPDAAAIASAPVPESPKRLRWIGAVAVLCLVAILASEAPVPDTVRDAIDAGQAIGVELVGDALRLAESDAAPPTPNVPAHRDGQAAGVPAGEELSAAMELPRGDEPDKSNASAQGSSVRSHMATTTGESLVAVVQPSVVTTADIGDETGDERVPARSEAAVPAKPSPWSPSLTGC